MGSGVAAAGMQGGHGIRDGDRVRRIAGASKPTMAPRGIRVAAHAQDPCKGFGSRTSQIQILSPRAMQLTANA
jgi:hypothetical protein